MFVERAPARRRALSGTCSSKDMLTFYPRSSGARSFQLSCRCEGTPYQDISLLTTTLFSCLPVPFTVLRLAPIFRPRACRDLCCGGLLRLISIAYPVRKRPLPIDLRSSVCVSCFPDLYQFCSPGAPPPRQVDLKGWFGVERW